MLKKRIVPCLDVKDGRTVKGIRFRELRDAGDPVEQGMKYEAEGADELVFLDITASVDKRKTMATLVDSVAKHISIPFTVGGGISNIEDVEVLLQHGADKVSINSSAVRNPTLIDDLAIRFGSQCVVVAVDCNLEEGTWWVYTHGGRNRTSIKSLDWVKEAADRGAGEILLTSMIHDGGKNGFALDLTSSVVDAVSIPIIASGGAGSMSDFVDVFVKGKADAALAASVFHYGTLNIKHLKDHLRTYQIPVR